MDLSQQPRSLAAMQSAGRKRSMRPRWIIALGAIVLVALVASGAVFQQYAAPSSGHGGLWGSGSAPREGGVSHVVMFSFKDTVQAADMNEASQRLVELKDNCRHPTTEKPYIRAIRGGKNVSKQNLNAGATHAFVVEFDSPEDRDYYIEHDPVHLAFLADLKPFVESTKIVFEFTDGKFT